MKIWKKFLQVDRVHLEFINNASRYIHSHYAYAISSIVYSIQFFSSHDDRVLIEKEKGEVTIRQLLKKKGLSFFSYNKSLCEKI